MATTREKKPRRHDGVPACRAEEVEEARRGVWPSEWLGPAPKAGRGANGRVSLPPFLQIRAAEASATEKGRGGSGDSHG